MFCVKCGTPIPEGANFCPQCKAPAPVLKEPVNPAKPQNPEPEHRHKHHHRRKIGGFWYSYIVNSVIIAVCAVGALFFINSTSLIIPYVTSVADVFTNYNPNYIGFYIVVIAALVFFCSFGLAAVIRVLRKIFHIRRSRKEEN